jgi:hypothetical protein
MAQSIILEWLRTQRAAGNDSYFTPRQIHEGLYGEKNRKSIQSTYASLTGLLATGMLEHQLGGNQLSFSSSWHQCYRAKSASEKS